MASRRKYFVYCNDDKNQWRVFDSNDEKNNWISKKNQLSYREHRESSCSEKKNQSSYFEKNQLLHREHCKSRCSEKYKLSCFEQDSNSYYQTQIKCTKNKSCNCNSTCTLISVKNPNTELVIPATTEISTIPLIIGESVNLIKWTNIIPDALGIFDNITGIYTAPEDGDYQIELTVNFETSVPIPVDSILVNVPTIEIYDVCTNNHILSSFFPIANNIISNPPLSSGETYTNVSVTDILGKGQVIINTIIPLKACQRIRVRALTNGLVYVPPYGVTSPTINFSPEGADTTLVIYKIRNSPIVFIDCNN